jgi:biotin synthase
VSDQGQYSPVPLGEGLGWGLTPDSNRAPARTPHPPTPSSEGAGELRHDWSRAEIAALFDLPFNDLLWQAQGVHRAHHDANAVQLSTLLSIKTGGCAENCGYCSQAAGNEADLKATRLMQVEEVLVAAREAKAAGSERFCMGAAWRSPKDRDMEAIVAMVEGVKAMGLETCMTLGMLSDEQTGQLAEAGLDYYNHNIDTSPEYYAKVVTTRTYDDRLQTLERVRKAGINVCSGGILGMGEDRADRVGFLHALATLPEHPGSVPINALVPIKGTPLGDMLAGLPEARIDDIEFVRTVAVARIAMPGSVVRLSAGRESMSEATQALCFLAGANSIFTGDRLLTTGNQGSDADARLFAKLGLKGSINDAADRSSRPAEATGNKPCVRHEGIPQNASL